MSISRVQLVGEDHEHTLGMSQTRRGIEIEYVTTALMPVFERMIAERAYEACEFSMANYLMLKDRGADWLGAIPVFPQRSFRHGSLYVRRDSSLDGAAGLAGCRIGVPDYSMTLAVWMRGILAEQYGLHWSRLRWMAGGRPRFPVLDDVAVEIAGGDLEEALLRGDLDVLMAPRTRDDGKPASERQLRRLIADPQADEEAYLAKTGIYPINHVVVLRSDVVQRLPELPRALMEAFTEAKTTAYQRRLGATLVPWGARHWTRMFERFGGDPLPYGLTNSNRTVLERLALFLHDQKLIAKVPEIDSLFLAA